jgi:tetratricopeptide (TPR) repeat protein
VSPRLGQRGAAFAAVALLACTTALDTGERHYRDGDRLAALETWRRIPPDHRDYASAQQRVAEVEEEFQSLVVRYKQRGRYFESRERLAESILNYRLALKLQPHDRETLDHVQVLSRSLAAEKAATLEAFRQDLEKREIGAAREKLARLSDLDAFDPDLETERRLFNRELEQEIRAGLELGRQRFAAGDLRGAEREFEAVLELAPEHESALGYLSYIATIRRTRAQRAGADSGWMGASDQEIRAEGFYQNALSAERAGDPFEAIQQDLSALEAHPEHAGARHHLARLRTRLAPEVENLVESGRQYYLQEDLQSALDQWRRALLVDPDNARAKDYVERASRLLENLEKLRADPRAGSG